MVQRKQRLSDIAWLEYGDPTNWRPIAEASGIENPRILEVGSTVKVPSLPKGVA
jgi:nucleoid-associated protein YgaU